MSDCMLNSGEGLHWAEVVTESACDHGGTIPKTHLITPALVSSPDDIARLSAAASELNKEHWTPTSTMTERFDPSLALAKTESLRQTYSGTGT